MSEEKAKNLGMCEARTRGKSLGKEPVATNEEQQGSAADEPVAADEEQQGAAEAAEERQLQGNRKEQARARKVRGEVERLAGLLEVEGEQMDLLAGADELEDGDALAVAARAVSEVRRGRGRPKGAANVRNTRVFDYLEALGHRDPLVTLSLIQTADTRALARLVGMKAADALRIQVQAAKEMLPYKYARKPQELNVNERKAHIFLTGTLDVTGGDKDDGTLSIFGNEINMLDD